VEQGTTFTSDKQNLQALLGAIARGELQLPDFQRDWIWDDAHVRSLLASVSMSYPIGTLMLLETGNPDIKFKIRAVEGSNPPAEAKPGQLILDGQQRLTTLFQVFTSGQVVSTRDARKRPINRWYYLDIDLALDPAADRDDAVLTLPESKSLTDLQGNVIADYSTSEREQRANVFPFSIILRPAELMNWAIEYITQTGPGEADERRERWHRLNVQVIEPIQSYLVPVILLQKKTPKVAVCEVFEKVNTGGVPLDVFELLSASFAAEDFLLRDDWAARRKMLRQHDALGSIESTDFLQAITLLSTYDHRRQTLASGVPDDKAPGISAKRKDVLGLSLEQYLRWADPITKGLEQAAILLLEEHVFDDRDLPYRSQLVPLAAVFAVLGKEADIAGTRDLLRRWYWCGVFGELYGGAVETRFALDLPEIIDWVRGGPEPSTVRDSGFAPERLLTLRTRNSAAYKGLHALLMRDGGRDFRSGKRTEFLTYTKDDVDIHHIFPRAWCAKNRISRGRMNSIVNKTPLSARTNRIIGGRAPSAYLKTLEGQAKIGEGAMDEILRTHVIEPFALRADDFGRFFESRASALLDRIEVATGKQILRPASEVLQGDGEPEDYEGEADEEANGADTPDDGNGAIGDEPVSGT
jgi:hypothetical protein